MDAKLAYALAEANAKMSDVERLVSLHWALSSVIRNDVSGDVVELGCNAGYTSVWLANCLRRHETDRELLLFDSFEGLPEPGELDTHLSKGECKASEQDVLDNFERHGLPAPRIFPGWFEDTLSSLPEKICFGYLDGDFYESILTSLRHAWPRLEPGGIFVIDDYCDLSLNPRAWNGLPGVKKACDEFFADTGIRVEVVPGVTDLTIGYVMKPRT